MKFWDLGGAPLALGSMARADAKLHPFWFMSKQQSTTRKARPKALNLNPQPSEDDALPGAQEESSDVFEVERQRRILTREETPTVWHVGVVGVSIGDES